MEGELFLFASNSSFFPKSWKLKYCHLRDTDGEAPLIQIFKNMKKDGKRSLEDVVELDDTTTVESCDAQGQKFPFDISTSKRTIHLAAGSRADSLLWTKSLNLAANRVRLAASEEARRSAGFPVALIPTEASERNGFDSSLDYRLFFGDDEITLRFSHGTEKTASWPYPLIRRFTNVWNAALKERPGQRNFYFEAGSRCATGQGEFWFRETRPPSDFAGLYAAFAAKIDAFRERKKGQHPMGRNPLSASSPAIHLLSSPSEINDRVQLRRDSSTSASKNSSSRNSTPTSIVDPTSPDAPKQTYSRRSSSKRLFKLFGSSKSSIPQDDGREPIGPSLSAASCQTFSVLDASMRPSNASDADEVKSPLKSSLKRKEDKGAGEQRSNDNIYSKLPIKKDDARSKRGISHSISTTNNFSVTNQKFPNLDSNSSWDLTSPPQVGVTANSKIVLTKKSLEKARSTSCLGRVNFDLVTKDIGAV